MPTGGKAVVRLAILAVVFVLLAVWRIVVSGRRATSVVGPPDRGDELRLGELLWSASREETAHRRQALGGLACVALLAGGVGPWRRASLSSAVGPWVAAMIRSARRPPAVPGRPDGEASHVRRGPQASAPDPAWEATPCADLESPAFSDGSLPLEEMVATAQGQRTFVAVTDHSQTLTIAG
jgi:hypothetical protein